MGSHHQKWELHGFHYKLFPKFHQWCKTNHSSDVTSKHWGFSSASGEKMFQAPKGRKLRRASLRQPYMRNQWKTKSPNFKCTRLGVKELCWMSAIDGGLAGNIYFFGTVLVFLHTCFFHLHGKHHVC